MMSMETNTVIEIAEEFLKAKEYFDSLGLELLGSRDGSIENQNKIFSVRKKK